MSKIRVVCFLRVGRIGEIRGQDINMMTVEDILKAPKKIHLGIYSIYGDPLNKINVLGFSIVNEADNVVLNVF